ncbi:MAG: rhodanese-like domain-containing protein [Spirochaetales bacterium]|nr:rhodanese-like domain-containing protein [Spirochaetales bacterium]
MKRFTIIILMSLYIIFSCSAGGVSESESGVNPETQIQNVSDNLPDYDTYPELVELMNSGAEYYLVDVRTAGEVATGYIPGALNISHENILEIEAEKDDIIVLYCRSGNRAGVALRELEAEGYNNVYNFGGFSKWEGETAYP